MTRALLTILLVALAGGCLPLLGKRSDRLQHLFIAFATGVFLGVVFLHLLPEVQVLSLESEGAGELAVTPWLFVLLGVVLLFLLEKLVLHHSGEADHHQHATVGYASLLGLCIHAFTSGLGLAATAHRPELYEPVFLSVVSHKMAESFSLTAVFLLAGFSVRRILVTVVLFACVTPAGVLAGDMLADSLSEAGLTILTALAAGTFLFVALCDLLPEVFHHRVDAMWKVVLLGAGVGASLMFHEIGV